MISINTLKQEYLIDDNIDDKYLLSIIKKGQDFIITPLLGLTKYNQLISDINNDSVNQADNTLIKTYIQPVLAYYVMSESVYATAYKFKNNPDYQNSQNADRYNELVKISKKYLIDSQHYEQILREYICDEGIVLSTTDGPIKQSGYKTGLYIG
jgi:hypothetical protein